MRIRCRVVSLVVTDYMYVHSEVLTEVETGTVVALNL